MKNKNGCGGCLFTSIMILGLIFIADEQIEKYMKYRQQQKDLVYMNTPEYKAKEEAEEKVIAEKRERYKNDEPFIGMDANCAENTIWGEPNEQYTKTIEGNAKADVMRYCYLWIDPKYLDIYKERQAADDRYYQTVQPPILEKKIVAISGVMQYGKSVYETKYIDEVVSVDDYIKNIHKENKRYS